MKRWTCELAGRHGITTELEVDADSKLDAEVAAIKQADASIPEGAPWSCTRSQVEPCWDCDRPGLHPGVVRKLGGDLRVMFCDEHRQDGDGFSSTVTTVDLDTGAVTVEEREVRA